MFRKLAIIMYKSFGSYLRKKEKEIGKGSILSNANFSDSIFAELKRNGVNLGGRKATTKGYRKSYSINK